MLLIAAAFLLWQPIGSWLGNYLVEDDGVQQAQAAVVLGGDGNGVRTLKAAQLAQAGYVPLVLVDGPKTLIGNESDMVIRYAEMRGFKLGLFRPIPFPDDIRSTRAEAQFVGAYLKKAGIHKILLVTSNYHTHRAAYLFRKINPDLTVVAIPAPDPEFNPNAWWTFREGEKTFLLEWMKTVASYLGM